MTEDEVMALRAAFDAAVAQDLPLSMDVQDRQTLIDEVGAERSNVDMIPASSSADANHSNRRPSGRVSVRRYPRSFAW